MTNTTAITKEIFIAEGRHPLDFLKYYVDEMKDDAVIFFEKVCIFELEKYSLAIRSEDDKDVYNLVKWLGRSAQVRDFSEEFFIVEKATFKEFEYKRPEESNITLIVKSAKKQ